MSRQDVEHFQSFCRKWINRTVKEHFKDLPAGTDGSLDTNSPRTVIRDVCLHKDTDPMTLTIGRMLIWWVEARGLLDEYIYGIPSTDFEISNTYYPQVKLHFREDRYQASINSRRPARGEVSFRWREESYTELNIKALANKIYNDFVSPVFFYQKGRVLYTYTDKRLGYQFQVPANSEVDAKKVIEQAIRLQDDVEPDWTENFREHTDNKNYTTPGTIQVMGEIIKKPKKRPIARVEFQYAELFIPGTTKPIILVDRTGTKSRPIRIG